MKKAILIQARSSSGRFPKKMMQALGPIPLAEFVYRRCATSKRADVVAIITSLDKSDDELFNYCLSREIRVYRGSLDNVLERYVRAAESYAAPLICRVCGDSPFVDIELVDAMFDLLQEEKLDYLAPDKKICMAGLDSEVVTLGALKKSLSDSTAKDEFEHVTLHIKNNPDNFRVRYVKTELKPRDLEAVTVTVDYPEDLVLCNKVLDLLGDGYSFRSETIFDALRRGM